MRNDIIHKEGADRTETIPGTSALIKQLANAQKISIGTVREEPMDPASGGEDDEMHSIAGSGSFSGSSNADSNNSTKGSYASSSEGWNNDIGPDDSVSAVGAKSNERHHSDHGRPHKKKLTGEALKREKAFLLWKYKKCNPNNTYSPVHLDMNNTLEEIEAELAKVREESNIENAVDFARQTLTTAVGFVEFISRKQKFFELHLNGWSEVVSYDIEMAKYDGVFAELYEEMRGMVHCSPWVKLIFLLGGSAAQFHITRKFTGSSPPPPQKPDINIGTPTVDINDILEMMRTRQAAKNAATADQEGGSSITEVTDDDEGQSWISEASSASSSVHASSTSPPVPPRKQQKPVVKRPATKRGSNLRDVINRKRTEAATGNGITAPAQRPPAKPPSPKPPVTIPQRPMSNAIITRPFDPTIPRKEAIPLPWVVSEKEPEKDGNPSNEDSLPTPADVSEVPIDIPSLQQPPTIEISPPTPQVKPKRVYKRKTQPNTSATPAPKRGKINTPAVTVDESAAKGIEPMVIEANGTIE